MSKRRRIWHLTVLAVVLLGLLPMAALAQPAAQPDWSKVHPAVRTALEAEGQVGVYAILTAQADLSGAAALRTKAEKTAYVFEHLTQVARETQGPVTDALRAQGVAFKTHYIQNMIEVPQAGRSAVEALAARADVAQISPLPNAQPDPVYKSMTPEQRVAAIEWNVSRVKAPGAWALGALGQGMVVASNDTGVDYTHPALVGKYRGNLGGGNYNHNYNWWNGPGSPYPVDTDSHGTHTTGTMVGDDGAGNQIGVAPGARWIACGGLGNADPVTCFEFFLAPWDLNQQNPDPSKAPDAINNSWYDTSGYDYRPIIQNLGAAGVAVIKSAGNWGSGCSTISPPGGVPEVIATAAFDSSDVIASFSSRGPDSTYGTTILKPEVAAPGVDVRSSVPGGGYEGGWSGTSMAAPHSTATVALIWSAAPCLQGDVPATKQIMMDTAEAKVDAQCPPFVDHPNDVWGWGVLDDLAAVQYAIGYCGGLGTLQGTVTVRGTGAPIVGATVRAEAAGGFARETTTDGTGFYTLQLVADTYTVTAAQYGYAAETVAGVVVVADQTTTQDLQMTKLPVYAVYGKVTDAVTGAPLAATVEFTDAPVPPVNTNPATGGYFILVAQGTWHMQVSAPGHQPETREVVVTANQVQLFLLQPLPCILLVDDDNNAPDVRPYFTAALDAMGLEYGVFDVGGAGGNGPDLAGLNGYKMVIWFSGDKYGSSAGPNSTDETNLAAYLDAGGRLFLSSQDYLYDFGLTTFGQNYLGIASFSSDTGDATGKLGIAGDPIGNGLGPYTLTYPSNFTDYGDVVNAGAGASVAFRAANNTNNLDVDKAGGAWKTVFFGTDWAPIYANNAANGIAVLQRIVDWFGGCEPPPTLHLFALKVAWRAAGGGYQMAASGIVHDQAHAAFAGATLDGEWTLPNGTVVPRQATTNASGQFRFAFAAGQTGTYQFCVTDMTAPGYTYNPAANHTNPCRSFVVGP